MPRQFFLPSIDRCCYYHNDQLVPITSEMYTRLIELCSTIRRNKNVRYIYRGDANVDNVFQSDLKSFHLANRLFMVGDKSHYFEAVRPLSYNNVEEHACHLFDVFNRIFANREVNSATLRHLPRFVANNTDIDRYFTNSNNREKFVRAVKNRSYRNTFDYYEMLLHTISENTPNNRESNVLSTSLNIDCAKRFLNNRPGIIIVGWLSRNSFIQARDMNMRNTDNIAQDLPKYNIGFFPNQQEICLKYGLPPHYILGYFIGDCFVVNHHLLNGDNLFSNQFTMKDIIKKGICIDQTDFVQYLKLTQYKRAYDILNDIVFETQ